MRLPNGGDDGGRLLDLASGRRDVDLRLDPERAGEGKRLAARLRHRHARRYPQVEEEIGPVRCARRAPAEAALDRADVGDPANAVVAHLQLPAREPLQYLVEHITHPNNRVLGAAALAESGVDERTGRREPNPARPEMRASQLVLGRLAENAEIGGAAVGDEVTRP